LSITTVTLFVECKSIAPYSFIFLSSGTVLAADTTRLTSVTVAGNIKSEWGSCAEAVISSFGGRAIIHRDMCMSIAMEGWS
jgi:hypothetical protein